MSFNQEEKNALISMMITVMVALVGLWFVLKITDEPPFEITTAQCPALVQNEEKPVIKMDGYKCEVREGFRTDLLQPSGLWINDIFSCWKLQMPIEEFCDKYPCSRNGGKPAHPAN